MARSVRELMAQQWPPPVQQGAPAPQPPPFRDTTRAEDVHHTARSRQGYGRPGRMGTMSRSPTQIADANRKQTKVWVDHFGCMYRICDMEASQLGGILRMLKRSAVALRAFKLVALLDGQDFNEQVDIGENETLQSVANSDWRQHVPMPEMFASLEADWNRRVREGARMAHWDVEDTNDADQASAMNIGDQVVAMINRLSKPEIVTNMKARANRSINI